MEGNIAAISGIPIVASGLNLSASATDAEVINKNRWNR